MAKGESHGQFKAQAGLFRAWRAARGEGSDRFGWKIGINDPRAQRFFGIEEAVVGFMTRDSVLQDSRGFALGAMLVVEPELAIRVGRAFDPADSSEEIAASIAEVSPALEILDMEQPRQTLAEAMSHNLFHAGVALGPWNSPAVAAGTFVELFKGETSVASARSPQALPPLENIVSLVGRTLLDHGEALIEGDIIISGAMTAQIPLEPGHTISASFSGFGSLHLERDLDGCVYFTQSPMDP